MNGWRTSLGLTIPLKERTLTFSDSYQWQTMSTTPVRGMKIWLGQYTKLWRACNLTYFIHSLTGPVGQPFASCHEGPGFNPQGVLIWNQDSPVSVVSLHWWPRRDWSLWPRLSQASSRTITRPSCWQCDHPTWSHTAFLYRFAAGPPSGFTTDIVGCWGGALWRACNLTAFIHSLIGPVGQPFASHHEGPGFNPKGGTYVKPGYSC